MEVRVNGSTNEEDGYWIEIVGNNDDKPEDVAETYLKVRRILEDGAIRQ